jgi:hypothetical protein
MWGVRTRMSTDEVSNRRCRWLLSQRGFRYWCEAEMADVLSLKGTNPDFLVETAAPIRFFLELKSFEQDTLLDRIDPSVRTFSIDIMSLQKRANRLVRDAAEQLLPYAGTGFPMVIMLDNYRQKGISLDHHTLGGLFGELVVQMRMDASSGRSLGEDWVRVDDGSPLAGGRYGHVSAVAALVAAERFDTFEKVDDFSVERKMKVRVLYNPNAIVPFPSDVFNDPRDEHLR